METINLKIDGKEVVAQPEDKNIVDVADRAKIPLPAPCYKNGKGKGCCNACVVDIFGEQKFACGTKPEEGMDIVIDREDLKAIRKERLLAYAEGVKNGNPTACSTGGEGGSDEVNSGESCCGSDGGNSGSSCCG